MKLSEEIRNPKKTQNSKSETSTISDFEIQISFSTFCG